MSWYLAPPLVTLRDEINALFSGRDKSSDGTVGDTSHSARPSDHNPDRRSKPPGIVRAFDIDEDLVAGLTAAGEAMPLVNAIITDPRVRYVIYEGRIWYVDRPWWHPYTGPNAHRHHIHVSIRSVDGHDRDGSSWNLAARLGVAPSPSPAPAPTPPPKKHYDPEVLMAYPFIVRGNDNAGWVLVLSPDKHVSVPKLEGGERAQLTAAFGQPATIGTELVTRIVTALDKDA